MVGGYDLVIGEVPTGFDMQTLGHPDSVNG